jgi:hypothetical protein
MLNASILKCARIFTNVAVHHTSQWRKFGPDCPWSYRDWVPPRRGIIDLFEDEALTI